MAKAFNRTFLRDLNLQPLLNSMPKPRLAADATTTTYPAFDPAPFVDYYNRNYQRPRFTTDPDGHLLESVDTVRLNVTDWPELDLNQKKLLRKFLTKIVAGETAEGITGTNLAKTIASPLDSESLRLYARDETRHGQELLWLIKQLELDEPTPASNKPDAWADDFAQMNRIVSFLNVGRLVDMANIFLVSEVLVFQIYQQFAERFDHPLITVVFDDICRDEAAHIRYHSARVKAEIQRAGRPGRAMLKISHTFGLFTLLLSFRLAAWREFAILTQLNWSQMLDILEPVYERYYTKNSELRPLKSSWVFWLVRRVPFLQ